MKGRARGEGVKSSDSADLIGQGGEGVSQGSKGERQREKDKENEEEEDPALDFVEIICRVVISY